MWRDVDSGCGRRVKGSNLETGSGRRDNRAVFPGDCAGHGFDRLDHKNSVTGTDLFSTGPGRVFGQAVRLLQVPDNDAGIEYCGAPGLFQAVDGV